MTIINLFLITIIVCFVVDCSGFINDGVKPFAAWFINRKSKVKVKPENIVISKPFSCSLCLTFWLSIIYILVTNQFTLVNLVYICILALLSSNISEALMQIKDFIAWLQMKINNLMRWSSQKQKTNKIILLINYNLSKLYYW